MTSLEAIFRHQRILMQRFHSIEHERGLRIYTGPMAFDLHDLRAQTQLRLLAWDVVEEIGELNRASEPVEQLSEIADIAHFLVEMLICSGIPASDVDHDDNFIVIPGKNSDYYTHQVVDHLSEAMYHLKAKPWRKVIKASNINEYQDHLTCAFRDLTALSMAYGMDAILFHQAYFDKAAINEHRTS